MALAAACDCSVVRSFLGDRWERINVAKSSIVPCPVSRQVSWSSSSRRSSPNSASLRSNDAPVAALIMRLKSSVRLRRRNQRRAASARASAAHVIGRLTSAGPTPPSISHAITTRGYLSNPYIGKMPGLANPGSGCEVLPGHWSCCLVASPRPAEACPVTRVSPASRVIRFAEDRLAWQWRQRRMPTLDAAHKRRPFSVVW